MIARLAFAALLAAGLTTPAAADEPKFEDLSAVGRPEGFKAGLSSRYAVWFDDGTWHVRTTTGAKGVLSFGGNVEIVGGKMVSLTPVTVEGKGAKKPDIGTWNAQHTIFQFTLNTSKGHTDGFDLKVTDAATAVKFTLAVGGEEAPAKVFIGAKGAHPKATTFYLPAHPKK
jgi:hypothetical protein